MLTRRDHHDSRLRWLLACLALACYILVYTDRMTSDDGTAILAVSAALVRHGTADIGIIGAQDAQFERAMSRMGVFGQDGALYSKKGIAPSLALIPFVLAAQLAPWLPVQATASLLNPVVTTLTVCLLYTLLRRLDFRAEVAFAASLIYAVATTAMPYAGSQFGEPLAGILLLASVYALVRRRAGAGLRWTAVAGAAVGFATGVNLSYGLAAVAIAPFLLIAVLTAGTRSTFRQITVEMMAYAAPVVLMLMVIGFYNWTRFGSPFDSGYYFEAGEGFTRPIHMGLFGLFLSPYRGLIWYSPVTLAVIPGLWLLHKHHRWLTLLIVALVLVQAVTYAGWWSWHGGVVWGPRFLVPVLPLLSIGFAPVVSAVFRSRSWLWLTARFAFFLLVAISIVVQVAGSFVSVYPYYGYLVAHYGTGVVDSLITGLGDELMFDAGLSAIVGHMALLFHGQGLEPAWLRLGMDSWLPLISLGLVVLAYLMIRIRRSWGAVGVIGIVFALNAVAARQMGDPQAQSAARLDAALVPPGNTVVASTHFGTYLLDVERGNLISTNAPTNPVDGLTQGLWTHALAAQTDLWFVTWFPPGDLANWQEHELWHSAAFETQRVVDGHRALRFHLNPPSADTRAGWRFGPVLLRAYTTAVQSQGVYVTLEWIIDDGAQPTYQWFVHLIDSGGVIVAQQDRAPLGGYWLSDSRGTREGFSDYLFLPAGDISGSHTDWQLHVGWIDVTTGQRLAARSLDGTPLPDGFAVLPLVR